MMRATVAGIALLALGLLPVRAAPGSVTTAGKEVDPGAFISVLVGDGEEREEAIHQIAAGWRPGCAVMVLEILPFSRELEVRRRLLELLQEKTGQSLGGDVHGWYQWIWSRPPQPHPRYAEFKSRLYGFVDSRFSGYFAADRESTIRLDEVRWGGVRQDGIPPLRSPRMIPAAEADWLADDHVVFGLEVNGHARAYPRRILAWHELFTDEIGGVAVAGVYCTLCGTVILYRTSLEGVDYQLGTSGFLYRSNKLMYDRTTQSLWSTIWGRPVIGPLVGRGIQLERGSVVTTSWREWRRRHPETRVLSLDTGHQRDYSEGAAYRDYFATDELMFNVPKLDRRLKNKAEVLTMVLEEPPSGPLAIAADFLAANPLHHDRLGEIDIVVLTDRSGANRVYRTGGLRFAQWDRDRTAVDTAGDSWQLSEGRLSAADGRQLPRLAAQRAFWFGWYAAYPETRLVR
jgi:hypothetical protein